MGEKFSLCSCIIIIILYYWCLNGVINFRIHKLGAIKYMLTKTLVSLVLFITSTFLMILFRLFLGGASSLAEVIQRNPQLQELVNQVRTQPQLLPAYMETIGQQNPQLLRVRYLVIDNLYIPF